MNLDNLIREREEKNILQKDIVKFLNINKGTYSAWESLSDFIPLKRLNAICNYLNISIDYAFGLTSKKNYKYMNLDLDLKIIGERLKSVRKEHNYSLSVLAHKLNTGIAVLSRYENGKTLILTPFILMYSSIFNISIDYLLGRTNYPKYLKRSI